MTQLSATMVPKEDTQIFNMSLGDLQMDYQRPENPKQHNVIIGNRGLSGRKLVRPVVKLHIERGQITSSDIHLLKVTARVDELEVSVDDTLITTMLGIMETMMPDMQTMTAAGFPISSVEAMQRQAGVPMLATSDQIPKAATIFQIDQLFMSAVALKFWVRLKLKRVRSMLPAWMCSLLGTMSMSDHLSLQGANISLSSKYLQNLRGKAGDLASGFVHEWMGNMLRSVASVLGHSSLMAIPKAPAELVDNMSHYASASLGDGAEATASFVESMTLDPEYMAKHKAHRHQSIRGAGQGLTAAIDSLGQGLSGMMDIFRRPMEGAKKDGVTGFVKGIGTGLVSGVVKSVTGVADAAVDFGKGVMAEAEETLNPKQTVNARVRAPRATYGPIGAIIEYSELDAHVAAYVLAADPCCEIEAIVPLFRWDEPAVVVNNNENSSDDEEAAESKPSFEAMVLTAREALVCEIPFERFGIEVQGFYPDAGCTVSGPKKVQSRLLPQLLPVRRPAGEIGQFQMRLRFPLSALVSAKWAPVRFQGGKPDLLLELRSNQRPAVHSIRMPWSVCPELPRALCAVLCSANAPGAAKKVEILQFTLTSARRQFQGDELSNQAVVQEECWEVQRAAFAAGSNSGWQRPFLPTEPEQQETWLAEGLKKRHPLLDPLRHSNDHRRRGPPMQQMRLWQPKGAWQLDNGAHTDEDGWQYASNWSSFDWRINPRPLFDVVRRRKWTIDYVLSFSKEARGPKVEAGPSCPASMLPSEAGSPSRRSTALSNSMPPSEHPSPKHARPKAKAPARQPVHHANTTNHMPGTAKAKAKQRPGAIAARQLHQLAVQPRRPSFSSVNSNASAPVSVVSAPVSVASAPVSVASAPVSSSAPRPQLVLPGRPQPVVRPMGRPQSVTASPAARTMLYPPRSMSMSSRHSAASPTSASPRSYQWQTAMPKAMAGKPVPVVVRGPGSLPDRLTMSYGSVSPTSSLSARQVRPFQPAVIVQRK
ncbi:unnamed protein product [Effrenium voratum]|nr:unnamed protein product [Effrenium voratum]